MWSLASRAGAAILAAAIGLAACGHGQIEHYGRITGPKTIVMPAGGAYPLTELKRLLVSEGWTVSVRRGRRIDGGECGLDRRHCSGASDSRYALAGRWRPVACLHGAPAVTYDMALVDQVTGAEVFTITGTGCLHDPVADFAAALAGG